MKQQLLVIYERKWTSIVVWSREGLSGGVVQSGPK